MRRALGRVGFALTVIAPALLFFVSFGSAPASAAEISGGCTGTLNSKDATTLTTHDPLIVRKGEQLRAQGNIPAQFAAQNPVSNTTIEVSIIDGVFGVTTHDQPSTGPTYSADDVNIDDYLQFGVGLYRVDVVNSGTGWRCHYRAYMKLEGDTLSKPAGLVGLAAIIASVIGVALAKGRMPKEPGWIDAALGTTDQIAREEAWQEAGLEYPEALDFEERAEHGFIMPSEIESNERVVWAGKVRLRGRPVAGFWWGLLLGLGISVLGWQAARWTLNLSSVVLLPLAVAGVAAIVVWLGWGYRVRDVAVLPPEESPPAPPEVVLAASSATPARDGDVAPDGDAAPAPEPEDVTVAEPDDSTAAADDTATADGRDAATAADPDPTRAELKTPES
jgi:hypothetical protein